MNVGPLPTRWRRIVTSLARGSLSRYLIFHLLPAILLLVLLDLFATWVMTHKLDTDTWLLEDFFWLMVGGQLILIGVFAWLVVRGVNAGLRSVNRLTDEIRQRSIDDMQPLDVSDVPTEIRPLITHTNDLLLRLDDAIVAQRRFVAHAAHQLRTPLAGLKLESELMLTRSLPDDVRTLAERIKAASDRMIRLGQQLLVLARADPNARPQDSFVRIDLCEWVRVCGAEWLGRARDVQVDIELAASDEPVWIDGDPLLLDELLGNLIDNALKYGTHPGRISLKVARNPPALTVADNGPGIEQAQRGRVFEAFYRAPDASTEGSGLGLAIVREIAHAHGAWWRLSSKLDYAGTRVTVVFPGPRIGAQLSRPRQMPSINAC